MTGTPPLSRFEIATAMPDVATSPSASQFDQECLALSVLFGSGSLRRACRVSGLSRVQLKRLVMELGAACATEQDRRLIQLSHLTTRIEARQSLREKDRSGSPSAYSRSTMPSAWTYLAIDAETGLVPAWLIAAKGADAEQAITRDAQRRAARDAAIERPALTPLRGLLPWWDSLSAGFATKVKTHAAIVATCLMQHNFGCRTAGDATPAMRAGVADHGWTVEEIVTFRLNADRTSATASSGGESA